MAEKIEKITLSELDKILADTTVIPSFMVRVANLFRTVYGYGESWLLEFTIEENFTEKRRNDMLALFMAEMETLAQKGVIPSVEAVSEAANQWVDRLISSRKEQWKRFVDFTNRTAQAVSRKKGITQAKSLFLPSETREQVAAELLPRLEPILKLEKMGATRAEIEKLVEGLVKENLGAGLLEGFLNDDSLSEIMVGNGGHVWVERDGQLIDTGVTVPNQRLMWFAERLAAVIGSRIDASEPSMDGFLPDGSRVHIIIDPIAMDGVSITIRRHAKRPTLEQLLQWGALSEELARFLACAVRGRANILISGGTSSGKTSLLNVVAGFIPERERVITMEDAPELHLPLPHVIRLRTRKANLEGKNAFPMSQLVIESLRMRPDRIVVGEVRGAEALYMIEAFNTGHDGGLSTGHANSPFDMLKRLTVMMKRADSTLDDRAAYELIASSIHLIVQASRRVINGKVVRGVDEVVEIVEYDPTQPGTQGFKINVLFKRNLKNRQIERVGKISERLADHLVMNGEDVREWI